MAAVGASEHAPAGLLVFVATYAAGNTAAFAVVGALRGRTSMDDWRGLVSTRPWLAWAMTIALLSLVGIPPLAGFAGKLGVFTVLLEAELAWLAVLVVLNTVVSLAYYLRVVAAMHLRDHDGTSVHVLGRWSGWAVAVATTATLALGLLAEVLARPVDAGSLLP